MADKKEESLVLRVDLDPELSHLFHRLKKDRNLRTNAETIRYCITEVCERKEISIPQEMAVEIDRLLHNTKILAKYQIYDRADFVRRALEAYILKIRREHGTLFTWSTRQKLTGQENAVAVAIIELQSQNQPEGVSLVEIVKKTELPISIVEEILLQFIDQGLVYQYKRHDQEYYYAPNPEDYAL